MVAAGFVILAVLVGIFAPLTSRSPAPPTRP